MKRTVRTEVAEVTVRERGLVSAKVMAGAEVSVHEANQYHRMVHYLAKNEPHVTVLDISGIKYISKEAREVLSENSSKWGNTLGVALIVNSFTARMVANLFLTINKPSYPIKVFSDNVMAYQWAKAEYLKATLKEVG